MSIRHVEDSVATDSGEMIRHSTRAHSIPSPRRSVLILIMIMALLCEYGKSLFSSDLCDSWFLTQVVPEQWDPALP